MSKQEKIEAFLKTPIKVGDNIIIKGEGNGSKDPEHKSTVKITNIIGSGSTITFNVHGYGTLSRELHEIERCASHIGNNSFKDYSRVESYKIDIEQLLYRAGKDRNYENRMERYFGIDVPDCNINPIVINNKGKEVDYQRGLVWSTEQKQLLIESIYNRIEIGKFVFRKREFKWVKSRIEAGLVKNTAFNDLIDGKQRLSAILEFIEDKYKDLHGSLYSEMSRKAQQEFMGYMGLTYVELPETTTDAQVIEQFLAINFTGVPMSREHISKIKRIKL